MLQLSLKRWLIRFGVINEERAIDWASLSVLYMTCGHLWNNETAGVSWTGKNIRVFTCCRTPLTSPHQEASRLQFTKEPPHNHRWWKENHIQCWCKCFINQEFLWMNFVLSWDNIKLLCLTIKMECCILFLSISISLTHNSWGYFKISTCFFFVRSSTMKLVGMTIIKLNLESFKFNTSSSRLQKTNPVHFYQN